MEKHIIPPNKRKTLLSLNKFEYAAVISERTLQIENGALIFIDYKNLTNPIEIAIEELRQRRCPLILERKVKEKDNEVWVEQFDVNDMKITF